MSCMIVATKIFIDLVGGQVVIVLAPPDHDKRGVVIVHHPWKKGRVRIHRDLELASCKSFAIFATGR